MLEQRSFNHLARAFGLVILLIYLFLDPELPGFPRCPVLMFTGWKCPGCGAQRALHQLLQGNIRMALSYNLLFVPVLLYAIIGWLLVHTAIGTRYPLLSHNLFNKPFIWFILALTLLFTITRNIWHF
jgi:hypothetical protein